ncbi:MULTISPECIES: HK97 family phage prohead protease [Parabacteroides]|jgi:phage head maturation protease|uniref:Prohead serine protease n=1 Tax=Siphoviridae sp. ct7aK2 TaxID=2825351 RepID=A0A8S5U9I7_9CAUD|nr:HK97 family phage prohead protease [Parabacteroides goldsteinii]DAF91038.1 MAG TPA: prohead serine protease [Siphoviridae sp. ct7aK2]
MSNIRKFGKDVEKTRTIPFVFSDETKDTYRTVFTASDWVLDRFDKNGIALFNHNAYSSDPNMAIGSARAWVEGKRLVGEIKFEEKDINPLAEIVFRKFLAGTYKGVSVRYFPLENGKWGEGSESLEGENPTYYIGKRELVEISVVPIPSNKNALVRSYGAETSAELEEGEAFFSYGEVRSCPDNEDHDKDDTEDHDISDDSRNDHDLDDVYIRSMIDGYKAICNF